MAYTVSNATINTAAAAVPGPYGPLTRVTDVSTLPQPNSEFQIEFTDTRGLTVWATHGQLTDAEAIQRQIALAEGINYTVHALITEIAAINTYAQSIRLVAGGPYTNVHLRELVNRLNAIDETNAQI